MARKSVRVQVPPWAHGRLAQWLERLVYTQKVVGSSPSPSTCRGSSVVEHFSEKEGVVSSILTRGTKI